MRAMAVPWCQSDSHTHKKIRSMRRYLTTSFQKQPIGAFYHNFVCRPTRRMTGVGVAAHAVESKYLAPQRAVETFIFVNFCRAYDPTINLIIYLCTHLLAIFTNSFKV